MQSARWVVLGQAGVAAWLLTGCGSDHSGPRTDTTGSSDVPHGLALSSPMSAPGSEVGASTSVVFVSAFPGTVAHAATAVVAIGGTSLAGPAMAFDGGFDPVPVPAHAGDRIEVVLTDSAGSATTVTATVSARARPRVVRTSPAPRRTDVPLNAIMRVVFSTPMTVESVREGVRLTREGAPVAAEVEPGDSRGVAFDLVPTDNLVPATDYVLEIAPVVEDVNGTPLGEAVTAPFTTTSSSTVAGAAYVRLAGEFGLIDPGWEVPVGFEVALYARALALDHSPINAEITLSAEQQGVVQFSAPQHTGRGWSRADVRGVGPGRATIVARAGDAVASMSLVVYQQLSLAALPGLKVVGVADMLSNGAVQSSEVFLADAYGRQVLALPGPGLNHRAPTASVTGQVAFERRVSRSGMRDSVQIVIRNPDGWQRLVPTGGSQYCPSWAPDGKHLVFTESYREADGSLTTTLVVIDPTGAVKASWPAPTGQTEACAGWTLDSRNVGLFGAPAPPLRLTGSPLAYPRMYDLMAADSTRRFSTFVWSLDEARWLSSGSGPGVELHDGKRSADGRWVVVATGGGSVWVLSRDRTIRAQVTIPGGDAHSVGFAY